MSRPHWNVLVFPGGTENGLEIQRSLRYAKEVTLYSASSAVKNHAEYVFQNHVVIPEIYDDNCLLALNQIIREYAIDFIFPANSLVIDFLVKDRDKLDCELLQPASETVRLIRSKRQTYNLFKSLVRTPVVYTSADEIKEYPVFIKPDRLYGSQGAVKIRTANELAEFDLSGEDYVLTEYLPGEEYTVDCFSISGNLEYAMARERERIRMGTTMHTRSADKRIQTLLFPMARIISDELGLHGVWFFQVKRAADGQLCLMEVESRVAGTMVLSRALGVNLPLANIYLAAGITVQLKAQDYDLELDRSLATRFKSSIEFDTVYIDLDDTVVVKDTLNLDAIRFLYQCHQKNKKVVLLSKSHHPDPDAYLETLKIRQLFDEVHWLREDDSKSDFIKAPSSIFIDDSFSQRREVDEEHHIPTFEPSNIDVLIDERCV